MGKINKTIYRVDDRFIHGQVIEGWIKYYKISNTILVSDFVASDEYKRIIYESIMPIGSALSIFSLDDFKHFDTSSFLKVGGSLVILGSIDDLYKIINKITPDDYINIGCLACSVHHTEITDTVFVDSDECLKLQEIALKHDVFVHKLPWEIPLNIKTIIDSICGKS